jgi:hypothetical protein
LHQRQWRLKYPKILNFQFLSAAPLPDARAGGFAPRCYQRFAVSMNTVYIIARFYAREK